MSTAAPGDDGRWHYLPALDAVRALAVVLVVLFHYWEGRVPGGFVGVDVFFVMSGFLITGILRSEHHRTGGIDLRAFWGRRIRRLVPAVVVLVGVCAVGAWITGTGSSRQLADSIGALTWTTNLVEAVLGGNRVWLVNPNTVLDHLWSLAIEEQFYLVWPLVALWLFRRVRSDRARLAIVLLGIAASATAMGVVGGVHAYLRTDTRVFELLAGAALSVVAAPAVRTIGAAVSSVAVVVGAGGLIAVALVQGPDDAWMYPWGFLLVTVLAVCVVAGAASPAPWLSTASSWGPLRHLGQVSYGVYLWHIPVLRFLSESRVGISGPALRLLQLVVVALAVEASYRFVEQPFRTGRVPLRATTVAIGYAVVAVLLIPLAIDTSTDVANRWDAIAPPASTEPDAGRVVVLGDLVGSTVAASFQDSIDGGREPEPPTWMWDVADPGCPALVSAGVVDDLRISTRTNPLDPDDICRHWRRRWQHALEEFDPRAVVIGGGFWDTLEVRSGDRVLEGGELWRAYSELLERQARIVREAAPDARLFLVRIDDWSRLVEPNERDLDDRRVAIHFWNRAVTQVAEREGATLLTAQRPSWPQVRRLAGADWFGQVSAAARDAR